MRKLAAMTGIYASAHFIVDFSCAYLIFNIVHGAEKWLLCLVIYNYFAFALQMPLGIIADKAERNSAFAALGCLLIAISPALSFSPPLLCSAAGLGNAFFHIGAGRAVLQESGKGFSSLGVFVSPGAMGLYLGAMLGKGGTLPLIAVICALPAVASAIWFVMPRLSDRREGPDSANKAGFTNTVSQVNKGQITIYPYNINTTSFGGTEGTNDYIHIGLTHLQYFQLNMDKPDMTVWYCIDDPAFSTKADTTDNTEYMGSNIYPKNDVVNDYYIYTCGNVTYTGMGHTSKISASEEKLLVNTLIASYRVTEVPPTVSFSNKNGTQRGIESFFIPYDGNDYLSPTVAAESRRIYFTVNDSNVIKNKVILPVLKIGGTQVDLPIYDANTDTQVDFTKPGASLTSTYTYYVKLEDVLTIIKSSSLTIGSNGLDFTVKVTTTLPSGNAPPGYASLSLRRLTLFTLN